jgi:hypothetical protein
MLTSYWKGTDAHTQKQLLHKEPLEPTETVGVNLPDVKNKSLDAAKARLKFKR